MANPSKVTRHRLEGLIKAVRQELSAFQLGRHMTEPTFGVVDVPLFGLRFKFTTAAVQDDGNYRVVPIAKIEDVDSEKIFLALASAGYLRWLRQQISTHAYLKVLSYRDRWRLVLETALEKAKEDKKGAYLSYMIRDMQDKPFMQLYHEDPEIFDWILK